MNRINPVDVSITNYNTIMNYKQPNFHNHMKKFTNTQISNSNDKSLGNNSILSTKLNSSESFLFKSIYINNNMRLFRMKNISLKNKLYTASSGEKNQNIFKKFLKKKLSDNFKNIKIKTSLPKMDNFHNYNNNIPNIKPNTIHTNGVKKITYFDELFRNELFDIHNFNNNPKGNNSHNNNLYFQESTKNRVLIRNYLYQKEKKYQQDIENNNNFKKQIDENSEKINYIYHDVINNKINRLINYNEFLKYKMKIMKQKDFELYKNIEILIKEIKELFISIKIKSDKLWSLFDIRNFLICVKEGISIKQLPLNFRCYNSDYLDELTKLNEKDLFSWEQINRRKNNLNIFHLPTNLLLYINTLNGLDNEEIETKFKKYLDPNYEIFKSPEEFKRAYLLLEKKVLDNLRNSIEEKNINDSIKLKLISQMKEIKTDEKSFKEDFEKEKKYFLNVKTNNDNKNKIILRLSLSTGDILINKKRKERLKAKDPDILKHIEENKDEKFLKLIRGNKDMEKNQFLYKFHELKKLKQFDTMKEYVYFYIIENNLKFFKKCPEYFYNQEIFNIQRFNNYINNIRNLHHFKDYIITRNIIYLLNVYENAINSFIADYKSQLKQYQRTREFYQIRKTEINNKKNILFKKQRYLDYKIKEMKINKYNRKFTKYRYLQRNSFIDSSSTNIKSKGKSFGFKKINKKENEEVFDYMFNF